jgi:hypothetical protein
MEQNSKGDMKNIFKWTDAFSSYKHTPKPSLKCLLLLFKSDQNWNVTTTFSKTR